MTEETMVVLTTCGNDEDASALARALVERRLAACVNAVSEVASTYRWKGEVQQDQETLLIIKTTAPRLAHRTRDLGRPEEHRAEQRGIARAQVHERIAHARRARGGDLARAVQQRPERPAALRARTAHPPLQVGRDERDRQRERQQHQPTTAGTNVSENGSAPEKSPQCRPKPQTTTAT